MGNLYEFLDEKALYLCIIKIRVQIFKTYTMKTEFKSGKNKVTFKSGSETLAGHLYLPSNYTHGDTYAGIVILGPMTFVKEQAPTEYAIRFAQKGYAALIFDPSYRGESTGTPRELEDPMAKVEDTKAAAAPSYSYSF